MKIIEMSNATAALAEYARKVINEPVIITSDGKPIAALLSIDDVDLESISLSNNPEFISIIEKSQKSLQKEGGLSSQEMRRRLGLAL